MPVERFLSIEIKYNIFNFKVYLPADDGDSVISVIGCDGIRFKPAEKI